MVKVFIVILSYNVENDLRDCLLSVRKLDKKGYELGTVVVENNSSDNSAAMVAKEFPNVELLDSVQNLGYTGGNNLGIKYALNHGADDIFILNPDAIVEKDTLTKLLLLAEKEPKAGIISPKIYFAPGYEYHKDRYQKADLGKVIWWAGGKVDWNNVATTHRGVDRVDKGDYDHAEVVDTVPGTAMFVKREVFSAIGLFDEKYFLYFEESDFCQRALRRGFQLWYMPEAVVWHRNARSTEVGSSLQDYYTTRNRLLFGFCYAPLRSKLALLRQALSLLFIGRSWQKRGVIDFFLGRFGKGSYQS